VSIGQSRSGCQIDFISSGYNEKLLKTLATPAVDRKGFLMLIH
jgi:hypothetical protein